MAFQQHEGMREMNPTEEDLRQAKDVAERMAMAIPDGTNASIMMAALGLLTQTMFLRCLKKPFVVRSFEDFAYFTRQKLIEGTRNAGH